MRRGRFPASFGVGSDTVGCIEFFDVPDLAINAKGCGNLRADYDRARPPRYRALHSSRTEGGA